MIEIKTKIRLLIECQQNHESKKLLQIFVGSVFVFDQQSLIYVHLQVHSTI